MVRGGWRAGNEKRALSRAASKASVVERRIQLIFCFSILRRKLMAESVNSEL
jgi:hypothetical protein